MLQSLTKNAKFLYLRKFSFDQYLKIEKTSISLHHKPKHEVYSTSHTDISETETEQNYVKSIITIFIIIHIINLSFKSTFDYPCQICKYEDV